MISRRTNGVASTAPHELRVRAVSRQRTARVPRPCAGVENATSSERAGRVLCAFQPVTTSSRAGAASSGSRTTATLGRCEERRRRAGARWAASRVPGRRVTQPDERRSHDNPEQAEGGAPIGARALVRQRGNRSRLRPTKRQRPLAERRPPTRLRLKCTAADSSGQFEARCPDVA
jgi:hypothetical protein